MDILTLSSLEDLRRECIKNPFLIKKNFKELIEELDLKLIKVSCYENFKLDTLKYNSDEKQNNKYDEENCITIFEALNSLSRAQATDERLWVTLCFGQYSKYTKSRWPIKEIEVEIDRIEEDKKANGVLKKELDESYKAKEIDYEEYTKREEIVKNNEESLVYILYKEKQKLRKHVKSHWFATSVRGRSRDNAISRLWWMAELANSADKTDYKTKLNQILFNSDYRANLLERTTTASSGKLLACITEISHEAFNNNIKYERSKFRNFMKTVDLVGKRTSLPSLSPDELKKILTPHYDDAYK